MGDLPAATRTQSRRGIIFASRLRCILAALLWLALTPAVIAAKIQITGNYAVLPDGLGRLTVADITGDTNVTIVSTNELLEGITGVALREHHAYVAAADDGLVTLDLTTHPPAILEGGRLRTQRPAEDIVLNSHYAYIANGSNGIAVIDIFNPEDPLALEPKDAPGYVSSLDATSQYLFAACGGSGLLIFDIADPSDIEQVGGHATTTAARRVRVLGQHAFVICEGGRMEIVNLANVAAPELRYTFITGTELADVDISGNFAAVIGTNGLLTMLNVSNPAAPVPVGTSFVAGGATAVRIGAALVYVRNSAGELVAVPINGLTPSAPQLRMGVAARTAVVGHPAVLSVWAAGTPPLTYQWSKDGLPLTNDLRISGTTNSWLVISNAALSDTGWYAVTISNALGTVASTNFLTLVTPGTPLWRGAFDPGGGAEGIDVANHRAYVAVGDYGFEVFDVSNPRHPYLFDGYDVDGVSAGVRVENGYGYVALGTNGLQAFDTFRSETLGTTNVGGNARGVYLDGGRIYVAAGEAGLQIFHLGPDLFPAFLGSYDTPGFAWNVFVVNGIAYVADGPNGLQTLAITNPAAITSLGGYDTAGEARQIRVAEGKAFVADGSNGLVILNISDPATPVLLGEYTNAAPALDLEVAEQLLVLACGTNGIEILDVTNPAAVISLGHHAVSFARAIRLAGNFLYVADGFYGVQIFELAGIVAAGPEIIAAPVDGVRLPGEGITFQIAASGTEPLTYRWFRNDVPLADNDHLSGANTSTLTVSNLTFADSGEYTCYVRNAWNLSTWAGAILAVVPVGTPVLQSGYFNSDDALAVHVVGETAFVASRLGGLQAIDWSDPLNPILVGQHPTLGLAQDVWVRGRYAYVASWEAGLEIFDVRNRTNLVRVGHCDTPGLARHLRLEGTRAYVADRAGGLSIVDVRDPTRPQIIGRTLTDGSAEGVATAGEHVFVAAAQTGLQVFSVADPLAPIRQAQFDTPGNAENVTLVGSRAYVADYNHGLQILDVTNPVNPTPVAHYQSEGDAFHVQVANGRAYLAEGISKVSILELTNPTAPVYVTTSLAGDSVRSLQVIGPHALYADRESGLVLAKLLGFVPIAPTILGLTRDGSEIVGRELVLSVAAEGTPPLSYQWYFNGSSLTNDGGVTGAHEPHLYFPALGLTNSGAYTVVISNAQGVATSVVAHVTAQAPGTPLARGTASAPGFSLASVVVDNIGLVAAGADGLQILDLSDLDHPLPIGTYAPTGDVFGLCLQTNLLYLALGSNGVAILDVSQPTEPRYVGGFETPGTALNLDVAGGHAYVADGLGGLQIFNISNPASASFAGAIGFDDLVSDVRVADGLAYLTAGFGGVKIVAVTNAASLVVVGEHLDAGKANAIRLRDQRAYVANGDAGLLILSVTNPAQPVVLGTYVTNKAAALDLIGEFVVLGRGSGGYLVFNVTNPAQIQLVADVATAAGIRGVSLLGNHAFLAGGDAGLQIIELVGVAPQPPMFSLQPTNGVALHGGVAQFHTRLTGGTPPLQCRWYFDDLPLFDDGRISGTDTAILTISNVTFADAGDYQLRVFGPAGVTNSATAQLSYIGPLQAQMNAAPPGTVIHLTSTVYSEALVLDRNLTLQGRWWDKPRLSGGGSSVVLHIRPGAEVTLRGVAIENGFGVGTGGGIVNEGILRLEHCLVANNEAGNGGGIANFGTLHLEKCVLSNNVASSRGGGLYNAAGATFRATNSIFADNTANEGGGVANLGTNVVFASLFVDNHAIGITGRGGGLWSSGGHAQIFNSTASGNTAFSATAASTAGLGGGLYANAGRMDLRFTTVANNAALREGGGLAAFSGSQVYARNCIFADNLAADAVDCSGTLFSEGYNLVQSPAGLNVAGTTNGNLFGIAARLGPLRDNGGVTWTHAPAADSPVIDAGAGPGPTTDARGIARPFDIPWRPDIASQFDLGAVEYLDQSPYLSVSNHTAEGFTLTWRGTATLQQAATPMAGWVDQIAASPVTVTTTNAAGFFRLRAPAPTGVVLTMTNRTAQGFDLVWPDFGILERAPTLAGPWDSLGGLSPITLPLIPGENEFFRVRVLEH